MKTIHFLLGTLLLGASTVAHAQASAPDRSHSTASVQAPDLAAPQLRTDLTQWWRRYREPELDALVEASLQANIDIRVAVENLQAARALLAQSRAARWPQTTTESALGVDSPSTQPAAANVSASDYDLALTASWDMDLFGRLRSAAAASEADAQAAAALRDGIRVAVVADTVLAYLEVCGTTQQVRLAEQLVASNTRGFDLLTQQLRAGEISPLELASASSARAQAQALLPPLQAARRAALLRLAYLQGGRPAQVEQLRLHCAAMPQFDGDIPADQLQPLLMRRPDVREAEHKLAAAVAKIGVAKADLYPRLNLGGALGLISGGLVSTASPLLSWSFPNQAPARARIAQANAQQRAALAGWDAAVLRALHDMARALAVYQGATQSEARVSAAQADADLVTRRTEARVRIGEADPMLLVVAETARIGLARQAAQSRLTIAAAQVALFRTLGAGIPPAASDTISGASL
ncbi:Outer membrane protein OprM [Xanthomonas hydrangeae]|uniref:TolC family protein n=1 Tax=Xanthomonas hydrangeae TaxID=2775159 RepID=UPI00196539FD|nr:Outer membrane protein OprM [Xanthomonas hydrangeae]CAD7716577.1 Outer membrane protein OprM [Xanthomonas hydrangeae]CAD7732070.1 Outer membrane protein OprM [Xanthomonas hydrangeae]CAD7732073.1 Outer membrane protein OprM [Xanthomonas hydrangeae]CAD7734998.1 Outer membrane protein OprM [Xanthomonas hydrangeae]